MSKKQSSLILMCLLGFIPISIQAQHSVNTTGGDASNAAGSVSYSVGQIVFRSHSGNDGSISEGVQQAYEIFVITSVEELDGFDLKLKVFPNPVIDQLKIVVTDKDVLGISELHYQLLDMNGKSLKSKIISDDITRIDMSEKKPGIYFLQITKSEKRIGLFKIMKR